MSDRHAWATSGVEEVLPSLHRIPLALPTDALKAVNVYVLQDADGIGLIDGGWHRPGALEELERGLATLGAGLGDITAVLTTHFHPDHYTLAVEVSRRTGCALLLGEGERAMLDEIITGDHGSVDFVARLHRYGVPEELIGDRMQPQGRPQDYAYPSDWLVDGDRPQLAGVRLEALATPGHTRGHFCFADDDRGLLFAGDHVLPHITPSIGYESVQPGHLPLADFLASLRRVRERPDAMLLPAHGPVGPSVHARVDELLAHHEQRLQACLDAVAGGAATPYEVAQRIPWTSRHRAFDELWPFDRLMAVHETSAHLELLELRGAVKLVATDDLDQYTIP